nr:immunoglobulin light chain junction region [Macaca mulatta]MOV80456.1 immunoglobulin light chain junction region [Macaca mulatta]MOV80729.1 immunoglobulin light chain junction region [Macaca mulatta]MOV81183.1 immunoglobulin light chain junction region [Macaca mulatta]MOV81574.1 immunoglobulin light chain junction region [Macaca mulatta]
CQQYDNDPLTF